jgi:hypothetical protein
MKQPEALVDPSVSVLEEIADHAADVSGGTLPLGPNFTIADVASWALGNQGALCTWTVECQSNCNH